MVAIIATATVAAPVAITAGLAALGFGAAGVGAGTLAAGWQAGIGNVVAGSWFAAAQSAGKVEKLEFRNTLSQTVRFQELLVSQPRQPAQLLQREQPLERRAPRARVRGT